MTGAVVGCEGASSFLNVCIAEQMKRDLGNHSAYKVNRSMNEIN